MPLKREGKAFVLMTILWQHIPKFVQIVRAFIWQELE